jgi:hypothetical protein
MEPTVAQRSEAGLRSDTSAVQVVPANADRWPDLEDVFGTTGDPSRCWCQWFFEGAQAGPADRAAANKESFRGQIEAWPPPGLIAHLDGAPVGWAAVARRPVYARLRRSAVLRGIALHFSIAYLDITVARSAAPGPELAPLAPA